MHMHMQLGVRVQVSTVPERLHSRESLVCRALRSM